MPKLTVTGHDFLPNRQRRTFADVVSDSEQPFDGVLDFFVCGDRQLRCKTARLIRSKSRWTNSRMAPNGHDRRWQRNQACSICSSHRERWLTMPMTSPLSGNRKPSP